MRERPYTEAEVHAALAGLTEPGRLARAQDLVAASAPALQRVLSEALAEGGWFGGAHEEHVRRAAGEEDAEARLAMLRTLVAEETRLGMLVGVAVGFELAHELDEMTREGSD